MLIGKPTALNPTGYTYTKSGFSSCWYSLSVTQLSQERRLYSWVVEHLHVQYWSVRLYVQSKNGSAWWTKVSCCTLNNSRTKPNNTSCSGFWTVIFAMYHNKWWEGGSSADSKRDCTGYSRFSKEQSCFIHHTFERMWKNGPSVDVTVAREN